MANTCCGSVAFLSHEESIRELEDKIQLQYAMVEWASRLNKKFADKKSKRLVSTEVTKLASLEGERDSLKGTSPQADTRGLVKQNHTEAS
ncbi:hypothetical protein [Aminobacterium colombiense]